MVKEYFFGRIKNEWVLDKILNIISKLVGGKDVLLLNFYFEYHFSENKMCNTKKKIVCFIQLFPR